MFCWICNAQTYVNYDGICICPRHGQLVPPEWHVLNRQWCDGLHRGAWPAAA